MSLQFVHKFRSFISHTSSLPNENVMLTNLCLYTRLFKSVCNHNTLWKQKSFVSPSFTTALLTEAVCSFAGCILLEPSSFRSCSFSTRPPSLMALLPSRRRLIYDEISIRRDWPVSRWRKLETRRHALLTLLTTHTGPVIIRIHVPGSPFLFQFIISLTVHCSFCISMLHFHYDFHWSYKIR